MRVQIVAHGFSLSEALKSHCEVVLKDKLGRLASGFLKARFDLSMERGLHIAHLHWDEGSYHFDVKVRSSSMYQSILECGRKAAEQHVREHQRRREKSLHHGVLKHRLLEAN